MLTPALSLSTCPCPAACSEFSHSVSTAPALVEHTWTCQHRELLFLSGEQIQINKLLHFKINPEENGSLLWIPTGTSGCCCSVWPVCSPQSAAKTILLQHPHFFFFLKYLCNILFLKKPHYFCIRGFEIDLFPRHMSNRLVVSSPRT